MTQSPTPARVDDVSKYYEPAVRADRVASLLFFAAALLSLLMPYSVTLVGDDGRNVMTALFLTVTVVSFIVSQASRAFLLDAERMRRKQLLTDAFGAPLSADQTELYYNNVMPASYRRLGANVMENAFFGRQVSRRMLGWRRITTGGYAAAWIVAFALRHNNLEVLTWITQLVFSVDIFASWLKLEQFHNQCSSIYDQLYSHFLHRVGDKDPAAVPSVLDAFAAYEAMKASTGVLLSSKVFHEMNSTLSEEWRKVQERLQLGP